MDVEQAQSVVAQRRGEVRALPAPSSVAEVMEILKLDQSERFGEARDFVAGLDGVDALLLRAVLEMLWADGQLTVAQLARENAKQFDAEAKAATDLLALSPKDAQLTARIERNEQAAESERNLRQALETLAQPHYEAAITLAREVIRRNPERTDAYAILANLYRLHADWVEFDSNMQKVGPTATDHASVLYAKALEQEARRKDRAGARAALEALLVEYPGLARAQAQLVLLQDDIEARFEQLQKLQLLNPTHALVRLEGERIKTQYDTAIAVRALQPH